MKSNPAQNDAISETGTKLINVVMNVASSPEKLNVLTEVMSEDMSRVLQHIIDINVNGMVTMYPALPEIIGEDGLQNFRICYSEAMRAGVKMYWAECTFIKEGHSANHKFIKYKGKKFQSYLMENWNDYFVSNLRELDSFIDYDEAPYILEAVNYFGSMLMKYYFIDNGNIKYIEQIAKNDDENATMTKSLNIMGITKSFILNGYVLCRFQDEYHQLAGNIQQEGRY